MTTTTTTEHQHSVHTIEQPSTAPVEVGRALVAALVERRFNDFYALLHPEIRLRSLNAGGPIEVHGPQDATTVFYGWYADATTFDLKSSWVREAADRIQVSWQFDVEKPSHDDHPETIEQHLFLKVVDGQVLRIDMVCSGWRPRE